MLLDVEHDGARPATAALHRHYMRVPMAKLKNGIVVSYKCNHFWCLLDSEDFVEELQLTLLHTVSCNSSCN